MQGQQSGNVGAHLDICTVMVDMLAGSAACEGLVAALAAGLQQGGQAGKAAQPGKKAAGKGRRGRKAAKLSLSDDEDAPAGQAAVKVRALQCLNVEAGIQLVQGLESCKAI